MIYVLVAGAEWVGYVYFFLNLGYPIFFFLVGRAMVQGNV